ncbi:disulfide bond formation protein B [Amphiplicatus metriothermophilus]|uniref:Disulfide bond formation protein DsbB n=1 Tax=Amphiplicatus metriothermophilus TaxID=1519374 RepID=A0A239PJF7_9PROT|nr:disulfide bond formation protein B [Amphiplicatus metriothermophilus]MBB5517725.1 disulfide bond formation protein DsbB [Amphiplicatus metriothermophilus]SNT67941.1 Disulfide bond formation protein DsbB [Amphiplicatus metriothermophilus]
MIEAFRARPFTEQALAVAAATSAGLLAGAHLFERLGGYPPCALCLDQREAHWTALGVALAGLVAHRLFRAPLAAAAAVGAAALVYAVSAGLSFFHVGVEFGYWPGPASCAGGAGTIADAAGLAAALAGGAPVVSCSEAPWRLFGVSMAGYNLLFSAGLFALTLAAALAASRAARAARRDGARGVKTETL